MYPELKENSAYVRQWDPEYWDNRDNQKQLLDTIQKQLDIHQPSQWEPITARTLQELGAKPLLDRYGTLRGILEECKKKALQFLWLTLNNTGVSLSDRGLEPSVPKCS